MHAHRGAWVLLLIGAGSATAGTITDADCAESRRQERANVTIVERFIATFNRRDIDAVMSFFTPEAVYHNLPTKPVQGHAPIRAVIDGFVAPAESLDWEIVTIAADGDTVFAERIDRFVIDGSAVALPVTGVFEIRDGRIAAWREYFDLATWQRQVPARAP